MPRPASRQDAVNRLNRIAGQVGGVTRMLEDGRYCIDILTQMRAIKAALSRVEDQILEDHAATCVSDALASGDPDAQKRKFEELVRLFGKFKG